MYVRLFRNHAIQGYGMIAVASRTASGISRFSAQT